MIKNKQKIVIMTIMKKYNVNWLTAGLIAREDKLIWGENMKMEQIMQQAIGNKSLRESCSGCSYCDYELFEERYVAVCMRPENDREECLAEIQSRCKHNDNWYWNDGEGNKMKYCQRHKTHYTNNSYCVSCYREAKIKIGDSIESPKSFFNHNGPNGLKSPMGK